VRSAFGPGAVIDPNDPVSIVLSNANGIVFAADLLPGDLSLRGKTLIFSDKGAKKGNPIRGGLASVKIAATPQGTGTRITIEAYADMSAATEAQMTLEISVGDDENGVVDTWESRAYGWYRFHN